jgi:2-methylaconitate cis-trans-isomerase PrpF
MDSISQLSQQASDHWGKTPTTSKAAVISRSSYRGTDLDYIFVQVDVKAGKVEMSGTCGNMVARIGVFSLDEGLIQSRNAQRQVGITALLY